MHGVSWYHVWKGISGAGPGVLNQMVIWETLMDAETLLLTGNTETVYGLCAIDLKRDGPVVIEVPPRMLGGTLDLWQRAIMDIGLTGVDKGKGGKLLLLPPDYTGSVPEGFLAGKASTLRQSGCTRIPGGWQARQSRRPDEDDAGLSAFQGRQPAGDDVRQRVASGDRHDFFRQRSVLRRFGLDDRA
jgi:hypothetical protein